MRNFEKYFFAIKSVDLYHYIYMQFFGIKTLRTHINHCHNFKIFFLKKSTEIDFYSSVKLMCIVSKKKYLGRNKKEYYAML